MTDDFRIRFLVVDDQQSIRKLCMTIGNSLGFLSSEAESAEAALSQVEAESPDIILCDLKMAEMSGLEFLDEVKKLLPRTEIAMMTGYGSIESAVQAMKLGAYDYISKPFRVDEMKQRLQRMAEKVRLVAENEFLRDRVTADMQLNGIVGSSAKIQDVLRMIARLKDTRTPVLITGESGTGKELVARAIHFRGALAKRPFVAVDCGSLVPTLIESELFGYEKGAFTGAVKAKAGLFESANGGTIFLDEIGELPVDMQARLLRVLQEKEIRPVGSNKTVKIDVRVIAATNRDLESAVKIDDLRDKLAHARARLAALDADPDFRSDAVRRQQQQTINEIRGLEAELARLPRMPFRKDLFFRLNVVSIHLPSLRERRSDIPSLTNFFLDRFAPKQNVSVTPAAMNSLLQYDWPGNVRELENCIERAIALGNHHTIDVHDLPPAIRRCAETQGAHEGGSLSATDLDDLERITIERVFEQVKGDKALAGKMLGISRATLYRKLKRYGIGGRLDGSTREIARSAVAGVDG